MLIKKKSLTGSMSATLGQATRLENLEVTFEPDTSILWKFIKTTASPHFSHELLDDIRFVQTRIENQGRASTRRGTPSPVKYVVFGSRRPGVFSLGGDLRLFRDLILKGDAEGLREYAEKATAAVFHHACTGANTLSFSLVQGNAMGGGFEAALAGNVLVAERGTRLGFPEVLFGLFPGMGAYTLLRRRVERRVAENIILSARNYTAEALYELGVVDYLCDPGTGEQQIRDIVSRHAHRPGELAFRCAVSRCQEMDRQELDTIAAAWVESAMALGSSELRRIERLVANQQKAFAEDDTGHSAQILAAAV